ncbi:MAG: RsmD family RNA methyltransferase [Alphaproteobacteria bacterium]|nr:RsmD family RNA methyltransferase [Alphaproteobacteria bacterium]
MNSKLQIISGAYRGRKLALPQNARPTQNMARGAVFNMLATILDVGDKITAWDTFGGSGAMGIEVLSRYGNSSVIFTDVSDESIKVIKNNTENIAANRVCIVRADAVAKIKNYAKCANLIFVDPPYENANVGIDFVTKLARTVCPGTIVVQEIEKVVPYSPDTTKWEVLRDKTYGRARFLILRRNDNK